MKQSVLEYKKLLEQEGLLVEFAEPEGKEGEDRPVTLVTYFAGGADHPSYGPFGSKGGSAPCGRPD